MKMHRRLFILFIAPFACLTSALAGTVSPCIGETAQVEALIARTGGGGAIGNGGDLVEIMIAPLKDRLIAYEQTYEFAVLFGDLTDAERACYHSVLRRRITLTNASTPDEERLTRTYTDENGQRGWAIGVDVRRLDDGAYLREVLLRIHDAAMTPNVEAAVRAGRRFPENLRTRLRIVGQRLISPGERSESPAIVDVTCYQNEEFKRERDFKFHWNFQYPEVLQYQISENTGMRRDWESVPRILRWQKILERPFPIPAKYSLPVRMQADATGFEFQFELPENHARERISVNTDTRGASPKRAEVTFAAERRFKLKHYRGPGEIVDLANANAALRCRTVFIDTAVRDYFLRQAWEEPADAEK